jgi:hypothetical protein
LGLCGVDVRVRCVNGLHTSHSYPIVVMSRHYVLKDALAR